MNSETTAQVTGVIRSLLIASGGGALMTNDMLTSLVGALAIVVGVVWSVWQKHSAATTHHAVVEAAVKAAAAAPGKADTIVAQVKAGTFMAKQQQQQEAKR